MPNNKNAHQGMFPHSTTRAKGQVPDPGCQKCCISLCSKLFINHFYQTKASPECLNILIYWSKCWVDRLRRTLRRNVWTGIFYQQIYRLCHYILHQVAHINCSAPTGKQHEPLTGVWGIPVAYRWQVCFSGYSCASLEHWPLMGQHCIR